MKGAPVSAPVSWEELEGSPPRFTIRTVRERIAQVGDLFAPILSMTQNLRRATAGLQSMI